METILICAVVVLVIVVIILARCVWNVSETNDYLKMDVDSVRDCSDSCVKQLWKAIEKVETLAKTADKDLNDFKGWRTSLMKELELIEFPDIQFSLLGEKPKPQKYYFLNAGKSKLNILLDHLKLEIINEPEKTVVRRKK